MEENREQAYRFLMSAAMLHLKWDLGCLYGGFAWSPWRIYRRYRSVRRAAYRAGAFHNLACFLDRGFQGFSEDRFWSDIEKFLGDFPEARESNYRGMFEASLRGEIVNIIQPSGGVPIASHGADDAQRFVR